MQFEENKANIYQNNLPNGNRTHKTFFHFDKLQNHLNIKKPNLSEANDKSKEQERFKEIEKYLKAKYNLVSPVLNITFKDEGILIDFNSDDMFKVNFFL